MKAHRDIVDKTLVININLTTGVLAGLALAVVASLLLGYLAFGERTASASSQRVSPAAPASSTGLRRYYLTRDDYLPTQAVGACADGFHFASMWEILDPSGLVYDTSLGYLDADSGSGPSTDYGWVRTGYDARYDSTTAGMANCDAWSSNDSAHDGTAAHLVNDWQASDDLHVWRAFVCSCNYRHPVWCVED
jgi:hypothetical protein